MPRHSLWKVLRVQNIEPPGFECLSAVEATVNAEPVAFKVTLRLPVTRKQRCVTGLRDDVPDNLVRSGSADLLYDEAHQNTRHP